MGKVRGRPYGNVDLDRKRERDERNRQLRIARGQCTTCPAPAAPGRQLCHDHRTAAHERTRRRDEKFYALVNARLAKGCSDCGNKYAPHVMHFDHVSGDKFANVSRMKGYREDRVLTEMDKCEVVCANCHADRTAQRRAGRHCPTPKEGRR